MEPPSIYYDTFTTLLWVLGIWFVCFIVTFYVREYQRRRKGIPGPWPIPFLGNLPQFVLLGKDPRLFVYKLSQQYGELCRFRMGFRDIIFVSSYESYCKLFSESVSRPIVEIFYERNLKENSGISFANGEQWAGSKTWTVKVLRELGFFKRSHVEPQILEEVDTLLEKIDSLIKGSPGGMGVLEMNQFFAVSVTKVMWKMIVGRWKSPEDDDLLKKVVDSSYIFLSQGVVGPGIINAFPFLKRIFPKLLGLNITMELTHLCRKIARELLEESLETVNEIEVPKSIIEAFAINMKRKEGNDGDRNLDLYTTMNFESIFMDLLQGSADPASTFLERLILFLALYPHSQERIYEEIQETFKPEEPISMSGSKLMKYTQAFFLEMHRYVPIMQQNVRQMDEDCRYKQYLIPKGSELTCDVVAIYTNLKVWGERPEEFRPERFLDSNGEVFNQKYISAFGMGRRSCPGQQMGEMVTFLFLISIVRNYKISLVPGKAKPKEFPQNSLITLTYPFSAVFSKRVSNN